MKKRILVSMVFICVIVTALTAISFTASAAAEYTYEYYTYTVEDGKAIITDVDTDITGKVTVPSTLGGYEVIGIYDYAFKDCITMTSVVIPDSVLAIGYGAFENCTAITTLDLGNGIQGIDSYAFKNCSGIKSVTIPDSVTEMGAGVFSDCSRITSFTMGTGMTEIPDFTCIDCKNLETVTIGRNVKTIGAEAFYECNSLSTIIWGESLEEIGYYSFSKCNINTLNIPSTVTTIGEGAFNEGGIYQLNIGNGVKTINDHAFSYIKAETVNIPDNVVTLGVMAFWECPYLKTVTIGKGLTKIAYQCFTGCPLLYSVSIGENVERIDNAAFTDCETLCQVYFGPKVKEIGYTAFNGCASLKNPTFPESLAIIENDAFRGCKSITSISLGSNMVSLGRFAFGDCTELETVSFSSIATIDYAAFDDCTSLAEIYFPENLQKIENNCFSNCKSLKNVYYESSAKDWTYVLIGDTYNDALFAATMHYNTPAPDLSAPTGFINSTNDIATTQTVTIDLDDNKGVKGYYWGKNTAYTKNTYTETSEETVSLTVTEQGTYYLVVEDINGNVSDPYKVVYYKTRFKPNTGTLPEILTSDYIITLADQPIVMPVPTKTNAIYKGWNTDSTATEGVKTLVPASNETYYAIWEKIPSIDTLSSIVINTPPVITSFELFDDFNVEGLTITASYDNGSSYIIEEGFTVSGFDPESAGKQTITVKFGNKIATYTITIIVPKVFDDVKTSAWYANQIVYCFKKGYINGMTPTTFKPNNTLTRAQFVTMLARVSNADLTQYTSVDSGFKDVKTSHWFHDAITWAAEKDYVSGIGNGKFGPTQNITREQLARLFYNYASSNNINVSGKADLSGFTDSSKISNWAYEPMQWAVDAGLINGMSPTTIAPRSTATRAQAATIFMRFDRIK